MKDYKLCSVEELADYFMTSPRQRYSQQLNHYKRSGNVEMVHKILKAKLIMKVLKMDAELKALEG